MTIVVTGGGSGGHITPILAVAHQLKQLEKGVRIIYIGQRGDPFADIPAEDPSVDAVYTVRAGKFRRYHGAGWKQLFDLVTLFKNIRDFFYVLVGIWQSYRLLKRLKPDVIFVKGGFVGVPVGLAAARLHIPYITHDSDAIPGLANRIIARWASAHAVALPKDVYAYPPERTVTTGIPLQAQFVPVTAALKQKYRKAIHVPEQAKLVFVIGGGLGSQRVNRAMAEAMPHLINEYKDLYVVHSAGQANERDVQQIYDQTLPATERARVQAQGYIPDVYRYSGAADLVITRAGATALAEFAVQGRACVVVPSPFLSGGHQLKNAQYLAEQGAAVVLLETDLTADPNRLAKQVSELLKSPEQQAELGKRLQQFAKPHATRDLVRLLVKFASHETV